jgi:hypothetical protein
MANPVDNEKNGTKYDIGSIGGIITASMATIRSNMVADITKGLLGNIINVPQDDKKSTLEEAQAKKMAEKEAQSQKIAEKIAKKKSAYMENTKNWSQEQWINEVEHIKEDSKRAHQKLRSIKGSAKSEKARKKENGISSDGLIVAAGTLQLGAGAMATAAGNPLVGVPLMMLGGSQIASGATSKK